MKTTAQKWGNSLAIRVPKRVAEEAGLREKDAVEIEVRKGMLVVRPHLRRVYRLEDLLKRITPRNLHDEVDFGGPIGREALSSSILKRAVNRLDTDQRSSFHPQPTIG